jgi:hypothetical protein
MTTEFELYVPGTSRSLLDAVSVLSEHNINLDTIAARKVGDKYVLRFVTALEEECRRTFMKADLTYSERKVLVIEMINRPGQWFRAASQMTNAGVELEGSYLLGQNGAKMRFVFVVNDYDKAKKVACQIADCSCD